MSATQMRTEAPVRSVCAGPAQCKRSWLSARAGLPPFAFIRVHFRLSRASGESGQALILAVVIMLLLLFLGTIFLKTVLANLGHAEKAVAGSNEYTAAEAGIRFADSNLTSGEMGADWRPRPSYTPAAVPAQILSQDPDYYWLQPFSNQGDNDPTNDAGGFVRYNLGDSRFLLRVTYNPLNDPAAPVMPDVRQDAATGQWRVNQPSALSRFVMIEAVGRHGSAAEIDQEYEEYTQRGDPIDPTVFIGSDAAGSARLRRELLAFKAIGINNYLRFVTDRDRLGRTTYLGVDQAFIRDGRRTAAAPNGAPVDYPFRLGIDPVGYSPTDGEAGWARATGSPIRVNGNLVWYGSGPGPSALPEITLNLLDPRDLPWNVVEVAGKIGREGQNQNGTAARMALRVYDPAQCGPGDAPLNNTSQTALPTSGSGSPNDTDAVRFNDAAFKAQLEASKTPALAVAECYLDNTWLTAPPDKKHLVDPRRSIRRMEPPQIETVDPGTGLLRYQAMTYGAGAVTSTSNASLAWQGRLAARFGYGTGIYLDNARHNGDHTSCRGDVQFNHSAEKLRDEWVRPYAPIDQSAGKSGWKHPGRVYEPPGVLITLAPDVTVPNGPAAPGSGLMAITRSDFRGWRDPRGNRVPVQTMYFEIRPGSAALGVQEYTLLPKYLESDGTWRTWDWTTRAWVNYTGAEGTRYPFNGVIFAEGNVRVRGQLPQDTATGGVRLSVVSRGTIYIEGNLLRGDPAAGMANQSSLAVLARDYVCLNTTQFVQVQTDFRPPTEGTIPPFFWRLPNNEQDLEFRASWDFGVPPDDATVEEYYGTTDPSPAGDNGNRASLFLRHQADRDPATIQWLVNGSAYQHLLTEHGYNSAAGGEQDFYPLFHSGEWEFFRDAMTLRAFPMFPEPTSGGSGSTQWFYLHTQPGRRNEIRIENYDPGQAPDGTATTGGDYNLGALAIQPLDVFITALVYAEHNSWFVIPGSFFQDTSGGDPEPNASPRYPRNGEPLDVQIHFVGAIAEGQAASIEDVTQWTAHWRGANRTGYETGALDQPAAQQDPAASVDMGFQRRDGISYAFDEALITDTRRVRAGTGEPAYLLPGIPRLPMCQDLVYFGERPIQ